MHTPMKRVPYATPGMPMRMNRFRFMTAPDDATGAAAPKSFTQEEVNALLAREKSQGERAGQTAATEALTAKLEAAGFTDVDAAITAAAAQKAADEAAKTEAERARDEAARLIAEATATKAEAAQDRHAARIERALAKSNAVDVAITARVLDVEVGADDAAVTAAVEALKTKVPGLFTTSGPGAGDPGKGPDRTAAAEGEWAKGKAAAERLFGPKK